MRKKKEYDDILKRFYLNLSLLSPESFFFNQHVTELLLNYIQNFVQSGEKCDFGFIIKNESSSELTEKSQPLNSILVTTISSSRFNEFYKENETIFDTQAKYNEYVKLLLKQNPIYSNFRKEIKSQLYYKSSQRIIFLAICHLIKPKIIDKLILDQKKEKENQSQLRKNIVFHENLDSDGPASFINSTMKMDYNQNDLNTSKAENSISFLKDEEKVENGNNTISPIVNKRSKNGRIRRGAGFTEFSNSILIDDDFLNENENSIEKFEENQNASILTTIKNEETKKTENVVPLLNLSKCKFESEQFESDTLIKAKEDNQSEAVITRNVNTNLIIINEKDQSDASIKEEIQDDCNHVKSENENSLLKDEKSQIDKSIESKEDNYELDLAKSGQKDSIPTNKEELYNTNKNEEIYNKDFMFQERKEEPSIQKDYKKIHDNSNHSKSEVENSIQLDQIIQNREEVHADSTYSKNDEKNSIQEDQSIQNSKEETHDDSTHSKNDEKTSIQENQNIQNKEEKEVNSDGNLDQIVQISTDKREEINSASDTLHHEEQNSKAREEEEVSKTEYDSYLSKSENENSIQNDADSSSSYSTDDLSKTEIESSMITEDTGQIHSPLKPFKKPEKQNESNLSISHNQKLPQKSDENQTEANKTFNEKDKDKTSYMQAETELFECTDDNSDFDFNTAKSQVFDALSLSFFEMRTNMQGRLTRSTELIFEIWSQISCCLFFEFISREFSFVSLKSNSSFVTKFEDFIRSLVQGFVSAEKQSYHDGVISLLPFESRYFFVRSLVTLDSIDREEIDEQEKNDKKDDEELNGFESISKFIDNKYLYYHHRSVIGINSSYLTESTAVDSTLNTTNYNSENRQSSATNFLTQNGLTTFENNQVSQKVEPQENDFSVSKFMNPLLASYRSQKNESIESYSMKIMLAKAVHDRSLKESRVLFDSNESSPLISRALELRGVAPPHHPHDPSNYSPRKLRKSQKIESPEKKVTRPKNDNEPRSPRAKKNVNEKVTRPKNDNEPRSPRAKKNVNEKVTRPKNDNEPRSPRAKKKENEKVTSPKPKIKVSHVNSNSKNSVQSNLEHSSLNDTFYTFNRKMKEIRTEKKAKSKTNDEKRFKICFNNENLNEKKKPLKTSIRRAQLAESKGFVVREKAIEQHNREILNDYEVRKRAIYRDICSSEAKCAEEIEKSASNGNLIMHSNIGKSVLYDKLEKNIRNKQVNKSFDRLNGRKVGYGMEYDTDFSQLEGPIATAILEDGLF